MTTTSVTQDSPLARRLAAWFSERFPAANALLFFILYLACAAVARHALGGIFISAVDIIGCLVTWSFFLVLRVFDEHKDYQLDLKNHPQRVLQSGLIRLVHLRYLAAAAITVQVLWSLYVDDWSFGAATLAWTLAFAWTCLMGKEFFCGAWLEKRLTLYAFSHMLVMPLIVWWLLNLGASGVHLTDTMTLLMALAFVSGFSFEITRKAKGADEERDTVDSYSRIFGYRGACLIVAVLVLAMGVLQLVLIQALGNRLPLWSLIIIGLFTALAFYSLANYWRSPTAGAREKNEASVALLMLAGYAVTIAAALVAVPVHLAWW